MENIEIANTFLELADLLEVQGANPFRVRAYRNAAQTIEDLSRPLSQLIEAGEDLTRLPAIGEDISDHIRELVETGKLSVLTEVTREIPRSIRELLSVEGIGPKRAKLLHDRLGVKSLAQLKKALRKGSVAELPGFGEKTVARLKQAVSEATSRTERTLIADAESVVAPLVALLSSTPGVEVAQVAGSMRRRRETVGDVDILVVSSDPNPVMKRFTGYEAVARVESVGDTRSTVTIRSGLQVDLRVVPAESFGSALQYLTGSKAHSVALRSRAVDRGLKINEYGVFRVRKKAGEERIGGEREEDVYEALKLPWIPPELRENRGEIEAAGEGKLPDLVAFEDIRGDLQLHSTWSDGRNSIEEMSKACKALGYEYMAVTDHSKALAMIQGLDEAGLERQAEELAKVSRKLKGIELLSGIEVDIRKDGTLDLDDEHLAKLDFVIAAVHSNMRMERAEMTRRLVAAVSHPCVHALAHPTGRLINEREPFPFDLDEVIGAAVENRVALEINANPHRLDLDDVAVRRAKELGAMFVINTDAHSTEGLNHMRYGVGQARRGWAEKKDVVNTFGAKKLRQWLRR